MTVNTQLKLHTYFRINMQTTLFKPFILLTLLMGFLFCTDLQAQTKRYTLSGYVREAGSRELLLGVNIYVPELKTGAITNNYGFYSITLPEGEYEFRFSYVGYEAITNKITLDRNVNLNIDLNMSRELQGVEIIAERVEKISDQVRMSTIEIPVRQIKEIPTLLGERDVFKVLQLLPGVQKGNEGSSGLYVRGGGPDQNLVILDEAIVYNASHLFGFFSVFNGDALKGVELIKGGFPARYGGRLSSVVNLTMKDGNKEEFGGEAGIGLISSRLLLEGPIVKGKSSFLLSGRRTYIDALIRPFMSEDKGIGGYYFHDYNAKVNYDFGRKNKLYASGYFGRDKFYFRYKDPTSSSKTSGGLFWQNATATLRWNHLFTDKLFANTSAIYSNYQFVVTAEDEYLNDYFKFKYSSGIEDFSLKSDFEYLPRPNQTIRFGASSIRHKFNPSAVVFKVSDFDDLSLKAKSLTSFESGIYVEDEMKIGQRFRLNAGFRLSHFVHKEQQYWGPEPRISASYSLAKDLAVKASYAQMYQYVHLLSPTGIGMPTDLWVPATNKIPPQASQQIALGIAQDLAKNTYQLTVEGYYKWSENIIGYKEGSSFMLIDDPMSAQGSDWQDNITSGKGWSYGAEVLLQKKDGKLNGWIGYTLSWTQLQFDDLNYGEKFYARYDRRHDASIVLIYNIDENIRLSGIWVYGTGNAITLPKSKYRAEPHSPYPYNPDSGGGQSGWAVDHYGRKNDVRMKPYHRMDIGLEFRKKNRWGERAIEISVYNAYSRWNPYFYFVDYEWQTGEEIVRQVSIFPIIPSISFSQKF